ncbi:hypothetical protein MEA186_02252 [Mesorhizobium amorphae CCNWGS0123]|uniref:Uncharacterized protein n=1 Tax=Mesorhizobium amorphae CCNWGS0123 TaxID=1082933 RepID=G6Y3F4_9HYPH|nr:hypothetical protein MEA186_02252 [Mesorhizobium amorphae CCNWGS0123]
MSQTDYVRGAQPVIPLRQLQLDGRQTAEALIPSRLIFQAFESRIVKRHPA